MTLAKPRLIRFFPLIACLATVAPRGSAEEPIRFNHQIRPILSENCFYCHGPDDEARTAGLRLDTEAGAKEYAIVPGEADASELVARITSDDPDLRMPPPESGRSLSAREVETLIGWIDQGASYESHWSFIPPRQPAVPDGGPESLNPIDGFVDARLREHGLQASTGAVRETLIRRATFDLTGLPPTLREIDAFLADDSAAAYPRLLDRLMARPEFGERMAADWLDIARYSDTYGYQVDRDRSVWAWRDWVIDALNENLPYDQFVTWQLAGDLIPEATDRQILATTFNRLHPQKVEGGSVPEEFRIEYVADRTQTFATAMMGLTMECCRCHSHKYDPLSQHEYYELSAFFDNIDEAGLYSYFTSAVPTPTLPLPSEAQREQLLRLEADVQARQVKLAAAIETARDEAERWASDQLTDPTAAIPDGAASIATLDFEQPPAAPNRSVPGIVGKAVELTGDDGIKTEVGNFRRSDPFSVSLWLKTPDSKERAVVFHRSRAWTDAASRGYQLLIEGGHLSWSLIHFWPGNAIRVRAVDPIPIGRWVPVTVTSDGSSRAAGLKIFVDGHPAETTVVRDQLTRQITGGGGDTITIGERFRDRGFKNGSVDQFRVFDVELTDWEIAELARPTKTDTRPDRGAVQQLAAHYRDRLDPQIAQLRNELRDARRRLCEVQDGINEIMVMREMPNPRTTYFLNRGGYDQRGQAVQPGTPSVLNPFPDSAPANRLGLARWLTDPANPLAARVAANRLWQLAFGEGLVRTPEDFGSQGEPPTHPDLLDWLATDLVEHGWDLKRSLKQIMLSAAYRRSSRAADADVPRRDPSNRWLARFPSYRLPAEMLRDQSLAVSGRLVSRLGGRPVRPYEIEASFKPSDRDGGESLYRRSLYTYWKRTAPAPAMMALDAAKRDVCRVKRERTSSPIEAFVLLNGPQYVEAARGLAERLATRHAPATAGEAAERTLPEAAATAAIRDAFRSLTSRSPEPEEMEILVDLYTRQLDYFRSQPDRTQAYLATGDAPPRADLDPPHVAALSVVVATVMNFDPCVMKR